MLWFKTAGRADGFTLYAAGMSMVGLVAALAMRETRDAGLIDARLTLTGGDAAPIVPKRAGSPTLGVMTERLQSRPA